MKKLGVFFVLVFLSGCGPKLPTNAEIKRDAESVLLKLPDCEIDGYRLGYIFSTFLPLSLKNIEKPTRKGDILQVILKLTDGRCDVEFEANIQYIRTRAGWEFIKDIKGVKLLSISREGRDKWAAAALRNSCSWLRSAISVFYDENGRWPKSLDELVSKKVIPKLPEGDWLYDPVTGLVRIKSQPNW